jgi:hypothetical protein
VATKLAAVTARTASQVAAHVALTDGAKPILNPAMTPAEFLDALLAAGLHADAVHFLAHGMPRREAVWWACVCVRASMEPAPPPTAPAAIAAAETWCRDPSEPHRRAAHAAAEATKYEHPAGLAALGAFFSGGSLAPADAATPVPPGPFHTAKAVANAIVLSAVRREPEKARQRYREFLARGIDIANGGGGRAAGAA